MQEYKAITSPPVYISPLDVGPKYAEKLGSGLMEYCKKYGENYCLGQLIYWNCQNYADPDCCLSRARRGCLSLPDIGSFYAKVSKPTRQRVYGPKVQRLMLSKMVSFCMRRLLFFFFLLFAALPYRPMIFADTPALFCSVSIFLTRKLRVYSIRLFLQNYLLTCVVWIVTWFSDRERGF